MKTTGVTTLKSAIEFGTTNEVMEILSRLTLLDEIGERPRQQLAKAQQLGVQADELESQAGAMRLRMREESLRLVESLLENWTVAELEHATGYSLAASEKEKPC